VSLSSFVVISPRTFDFPRPVPRVYVSSFRNEPLKSNGTENLFLTDREDFLQDLKDLPKRGPSRRLNSLMKRVKELRAHAHIMNYFSQEMRFCFFSCQKRKEHLIETLPAQFRSFQIQHGLALVGFFLVSFFDCFLSYFFPNPTGRLPQEYRAL